MLKVYEGKGYLVFPLAPLNEVTVIYTASSLGKSILALMLYFVVALPLYHNPWLFTPLGEPTNSVYLGCRSSARRIRKLWSSFLNMGFPSDICRLHYHDFQSRRDSKAVDEADFVIVDSLNTVRMDLSVFKNKTVLIFAHPSFRRSSIFKGANSWELYETPAEVKHWPWFVERRPPAKKALKLVLIPIQQGELPPFGYRVEFRPESIEVYQWRVTGIEVCKLTGKRW
ncbi:hypothetical protein ACFLWE_00420 [Chloroflexota bacterium]